MTRSAPGVVRACEWGAGLRAPPWGSTQDGRIVPWALRCCVTVIVRAFVSARWGKHTDSSRSLYLLTCRFPPPANPSHPMSLY